MKHPIPRCAYIAFLILAIGLGACSGWLSPAEGEPVSFIVSIPVSKFSRDSRIEIRVWNTEQLAVLEKAADCIVEAPVQSGPYPQVTPEVICPEGVVYETATAQEFVFDVRTVKDSVSLPATTVRAGEEYKVSIQGRNQDNCNTTSSSISGTAKTSTILLDNLVWGTTQMACTLITEPAP